MKTDTFENKNNFTICYLNLKPTYTCYIVVKFLDGKHFKLIQLTPFGQGNLVLDFKNWY